MFSSIICCLLAKNRRWLQNTTHYFYYTHTHQHKESQSDDRYVNSFCDLMSELTHHLPNKSGVRCPESAELSVPETTEQLATSPRCLLIDRRLFYFLFWMLHNHNQFKHTQKQNKNTKRLSCCHISMRFHSNLSRKTMSESCLWCFIIKLEQWFVSMVFELVYFNGKMIKKINFEQKDNALLLWKLSSSPRASCLRKTDGPG